MTVLWRLLSVLSIALTALASLGCESLRIGGTDDRHLDYKIEVDPDLDEGAAPLAPDVVLAYVQSRLWAAQVTAEVLLLDDQHVRVILDSRSAEEAKRMLRWRGGTMLYRVDPKTPFEPLPQVARALERHVEPTGEIYWSGASGDVRDAIAGSEPLKGRMVLAQYTGNLKARTRVVFPTPLVDLSNRQTVVKAIGRIDNGRSVGISLKPAATEAIARVAVRHPDVDVAITRSNAIMGVQSIQSVLDVQGLILSFGTDVWAYTFAQHELQLLNTPQLPPLTKVAEVAAPTRWGIVLACVLLPFVLSLGWLTFVRKFDRANPEPMWLVGSTFLLGCLSVVPAIFLERWLMNLSPYTNPGVMTLGGQLFAFPFALIVFTVSVGLIEEGVKFLGAWTLARHRREFDEPVDGIVYGCASALGFAAIENIRYFGDTRLSSAVIVARTFMSVPVHMFFGALWGYAMGRKLVRKKTRVWAWFLLAALAHGAFDACLSIRETVKLPLVGTIAPLPILATVLHVGLGLAFVALLRKSLRHGAVAPKRPIYEEPAEEAPPDSAQRMLVKMGSSTQFWVSVVAMLTSAAAVMHFGNQYEVSNAGAAPAILIAGGALLTFFGIAAYSVTATIPLDVAVDHVGITFAGSRAHWTTILGVEEAYALTIEGKRGWVKLRTTRGDVRLGPASPDTCSRLAQVIAFHLARRAAPAQAVAVTPP